MARKSLREDIVTAAIEQFHILGYNGTSVKTITDAAGAPKGSFYNHFDSKQELAIIALECYARTRRVDELLDRSADPLRRLRAHFEFLRNENLDYDFRRGCLVGDLAVEAADNTEEIRVATKEIFQVWLGAIASTIDDAQQAGLVSRAVAPGTLARFILSAWEGTLIAARVERSPRPYEAFFTMVFDSVLR